jgi:23S rRNA pseudouridine2457 synthase
MLSQFTEEVVGQTTLKHIDFSFPPDVYPVGRLDADSEGLLLLTNDSSCNARLLHPQTKQEKTYWVQVEGDITETALDSLRKGVSIRIQQKNYQTLPAKASRLSTPHVPPRTPPIRFRQHIPTSWIALSLTEGKNRQVRRMTAAVGFPTLRLIRTEMAGFRLDEMKIGEVREVSGF